MHERNAANTTHHDQLRAVGRAPNLAGIAAILALLAIAFVAQPGLAQDTTGQAPFAGHYSPSDYREPLRPQFHFSPQNGWMNDVNALWYLNGRYHMFYQWGRQRRHAGYATSPDLLHWRDHGVALIPQESHIKGRGAKPNVTGKQVFSGSGVIVSGEIAKKITGSSKTAMVTHYTGTGAGTCIAWSNDDGATWHNYHGNPIAHKTETASPRDPCVFWFEPDKKWILALFRRGGTTFHDSKDLINWTETSHLKFGYECPDVYHLPLDGDPNQMKWVIADANGWYLVGQFDGKTFTPEQKVQKQDVGPDFYAAQCFFIDAPDQPAQTPRYLQIAWMDHWNGGVGEKVWMRNATFPVELNLVTYKGKMTLTRNPINAIAKLYAETETYQETTVTDKISWQPKKGSKTFDLSIVIDASQSTASQVVIELNGYPVPYDLKKEALVLKGLANERRTRKPIAGMTHTLTPTPDGEVKLRFLVDWSCLEIFGNDGILSYTEQVGFSPTDNTLAVRAVDGSAKIKSIEFNTIKSIWAPTGK